jgi:phage terminase Nu1 subunit (DNA packaging protein)
MRKPQSYFVQTGLLRKEEVAEMLNCSVRTVDKYRRQGMPCIKKKGVGVIFDAQKVLDWFYEG